MEPRPGRFPAALLFGMPGSGKGTQGDLLRSIPGFFHVSTGLIFRQLDAASPEGRAVHETIGRGELIDDALTISVFSKWLHERCDAGDYVPGEHLLVLDGIPRSRPQCGALSAFVDVRLVLHLVCRDEQAMIRRIRRRADIENRPDDGCEDVIRRRFEIFRRDTAPVLDEYPSDLVREVESTQAQAEVLLHCLQHLVPVMKSMNGSGGTA